MNSHRRRTWVWFLANAVVLLSVMVWLTATMSALGRDELAARQRAQLHEKLRLGLWRMDSWLSPQLAREAMRPASDYRAFAPAATAWTSGYSKLPPNEVLMPSPLLGFRSDVFPLHFELDPRGVLSSPQVPTGNQRDVAENTGVSGAEIEAAGARLAALQPRLQLHRLERSLGAAEALLPTVGCNAIPPGAGADAAQSVQEYSNRQIANLQSQGQSNSKATPQWSAAAGIGPMLPFWLDGNGDPMLVLARRVRDDTGTRLQGVVVDWQALSREMVALVADLFDGGSAALVRCDGPTPDQQGSMLATVPARLSARPAGALTANALPTATILVITWGMTLLALGVLGFTMRQAIGFGERRARFASAVTHELRTPLTTFRMYSEMLADGMVTDPAAQRAYLETLRQESDRLARVVENVLAWSRLEEGRFASRRERHGVGSLLQQRLAPPLQRRLADAGMSLRLSVAAAAHDAVLVTDEDAVGQILFNLVDNAAKYARAAALPEVEISAVVEGDLLHIAVRDHGKGVPSAHRTRIFAPFDRGAVPTASNDVPGVGLGLPLARGLARDLGGELRLDAAVTDGAAFVLTLPLA